MALSCSALLTSSHGGDQAVLWSPWLPRRQKSAQERLGKNTGSGVGHRSKLMWVWRVSEGRSQPSRVHLFWYVSFCSWVMHSCGWRSRIHCRHRSYGEGFRRWTAKIKIPKKISNFCRFHEVSGQFCLLRPTSAPLRLSASLYSSVRVTTHR